MRYIIPATPSPAHLAIHLTRYLIDVLVSPWVLRTLSRLALFFLCYGREHWASICALGLMYLWRYLQLSAVVSWALSCCIMGTTLAAVMDNMIVVLKWKKRHVWVPLAWWVTFVRVSSGREAPQGIWCDASHRLLCRSMPWFIRLGVLSALSASWQSASLGVMSMSMSMSMSMWCPVVVPGWGAWLECLVRVPG